MRSVFVSGNLSIPSLWKALLDFGLSASASNSFLVLGDQLAPIHQNWYSAMAILKKNWARKYFVSCESYLFGYYSKVPPQLSGVLETKTLDLKIAVKQRALLNKTLSLIANAEWYRYNMLADVNDGLLFCELECRYNIQRRPWSFSVKLSNITNERFYYSKTENAIGQHFFALPLIGRNAFVSARYEL